MIFAIGIDGAHISLTNSFGAPSVIPEEPVRRRRSAVESRRNKKMLKEKKSVFFLVYKKETKRVANQ